MKADGLDPLPTYTPPWKTADPPRPRRAVPAPVAEPPAAPVPQLDVRQLRASPSRGRRSHCRAGRRRRAGAGASMTANGSRSTTTAAGSSASRPDRSVRPGVAVATGIYWNKMVPGGERQQHVVHGPDRHGRRRQPSSTTWSMCGRSRLARPIRNSTEVCPFRVDSDGILWSGRSASGSRGNTRGGRDDRRSGPISGSMARSHW